LYIYRASGAYLPGGQSQGSYDIYISLALARGRKLRLVAGRNNSYGHRLINIYLGSQAYKTVPDLWSAVSTDAIPLKSCNQGPASGWVIWSGDMAIPDNYPVAVVRCVNALSDSDTIDLMVGVD